MKKNNTPGKQLGKNQMKEVKGGGPIGGIRYYVCIDTCQVFTSSCNRTVCPGGCIGGRICP